MGRAAELETIAECRARAAAGTPWAVVVQGEAGIGKTALVRRGLLPGPDRLHVCWAGCDPAEQDLPYGVLDQLLRRLPRGTGGLRDLAGSLTPAASPLALGGDLLAVLASAADAAPLALVVDDIAWADPQSLAALGFVMRRLYAEPVLLVATARFQASPGPAEAPQPASPWQDALLRGTGRVQWLRLDGLGAADATELAAAVGATGLSPAAAVRLLEGTGGHPLHLQTLLSQVTFAQLEDLSRPLPVPASLDAAIRHNLDRLPDGARRLVEAMAVLDAPAPLVVGAGLAGIPDAGAALAPALECGLLEWQPDEPATPLRIHHRLQRDAVYRAISPTRRKDLHAAAATLVGRDESWFHRVVAFGSTDPRLVDELAAEAQRQVIAGGYQRATTLELWAADLADSREGREQHLLTAATYQCLGGSDARALTLRAAVGACTPSPRRDAVLGGLALFVADLAAAEPLLTHALDGADDPGVRALSAQLLGALHLARGNGVAAFAVLRPLVEEAPPGFDTRVARGVLALAASQRDGPLAGLGVLADPGLTGQNADEDDPLLAHRGTLKVFAGELAAGIDDCAAYLGDRSAKDATLQAMAQQALGWGHCLTGRWEDAAISAERGLAALEAGGHGWAAIECSAIAVFAQAQQGHPGTAQTHLETMRPAAQALPEFGSFFTAIAEAAVAQADGDYPAMHRAVRIQDDPALAASGLRTFLPLLWVPLAVEAATAAEHPDADELQLAQEALHALDTLADRAPALTATVHWLQGRLAAAQGWHDEALSRYLAGLDTPARPGDDIPLRRAFLHRDLARLLQSAGSAADRPRISKHLQHALEEFTALGATPYSERTATGLAGNHPGAPTGPVGSPAGPLTERERHVAHLAAQGLTNQEIARELFLSPKTVEYPLGHIYTKLGITSRRRLRATLHPVPD
jgi:DNA-binding CsgD family transcriptional regulator